MKIRVTVIAEWDRPDEEIEELFGTTDPEKVIAIEHEAFMDDWDFFADWLETNQTDIKIEHIKE